MINGTHHKSGIQTAQLIFQEAQMDFHENIPLMNQFSLDLFCDNWHAHLRIDTQFIR